MWKTKAPAYRMQSMWLLWLSKAWPFTTFMAKTNSDPRHLRRRQIIQELFAQGFAKQETLSETATEVLKKQSEIDPMVESAAPQWPIEKINKIDLAILQLAIFELLEKREPIKVIIDEAVELAKEFGGESSPAFVNGVLGAIVNKKTYNEQ